MDVNRNKLLGLILAGVIAICSAALYITVTSSKPSEEICILGYKASDEGNNISGYEIKKHENIETTEWLDNDNLLVLKDNGSFKNPDEEIDKYFISKYNLNSMEMKDYTNVNLGESHTDGFSPSGRYVLFGEPRVIPKVGSAEWQRACDSKELFHEKKDILDLETGEIIEDFDKVVNNCSADYKWMSNDLIFVDYGGEWNILDMKGKRIKKGMFSFNNSSNNFTTLIDVSELDVTDGEVNGSFYYTKEFMGNDGNLGQNLFSMDVNTCEEKLVCGFEHSMDYIKAGNIIAFEDFDNNGEAENGIYVNRTFGFKIVNKQGELLQNVSLLKGRNFKGLTLSPNGEKCAFIEEDSCISEEGGVKDRSTINNIVKVMDIKTGEIKEVVQLKDLIDVDNEERFIRFKGFDMNGQETIIKGIGPVISEIKWDKAGSSLTFNYDYTSKVDGKNYTNTYVVTFDR